MKKQKTTRRKTPAGPKKLNKNKAKMSSKPAKKPQSKAAPAKASKVVSGKIAKVKEGLKAAKAALLKKADVKKADSKKAKDKKAPAPKAPAKPTKLVAKSPKGKKGAEKTTEKATEKNIVAAVLKKKGSEKAEKKADKKGDKKSEKKASAAALLAHERMCRESNCENLATTKGYCRLHYIQNWKKIKRKEMILKEGKLNQYVEELVSKYPDKYIEVIRQDLATEVNFNKVIHDLELDESIDDLDYDSDSIDSLIGSIRKEGEGFDDDEF